MFLSIRLQLKGDIKFLEKTEFYHEDLIPYLLEQNYSADEINEFLNLFSYCFINALIVERCYAMGEDKAEEYARYYSEAIHHYKDEMAYIFIYMTLMFTDISQQHASFLTDLIYEIGIDELSEMSLAEKERKFIDPILKFTNNLELTKHLVDGFRSAFIVFLDMCGLKFDIATLCEELEEVLKFKEINK